LAGPVYAAVVIFPPNYSNPELQDSKKLSEKQRNKLRIQIEKDALTWAVGIVDNNEIDEINILKASFLAMHRAIDLLTEIPEHLIIDGNRFTPYKNIPHSCIIKGDGKYMAIAAASILAKTHRDEYMEKMHVQYPLYDWNSNKGYPTEKHRKAIQEYGLTSLHRRTFNTSVQLQLLFE